MRLSRLFGHPAKDPWHWVVDDESPGDEWIEIRALPGLSAHPRPGSRPFTLWQRTLPSRTSSLTEGTRPYEDGNWQAQRVVYAPSLDACPEIAEVAGAPGAVIEGLAAAVASSARDVTKLRADIQLVAPGSLPNDGKVIEDARSYS